MAHNVQIEKLRKMAKDGHVIPNKYRYIVTCKHKNCGPLGETTSQSLADLCKANHHTDMRQQHSAKHPHDARQKSEPTGKRVQKKMVKLRG